MGIYGTNDDNSAPDWTLVTEDNENQEFKTYAVYCKMKTNEYYSHFRATIPMTMIHISIGGSTINSSSISNPT